MWTLKELIRHFATSAQGILADSALQPNGNGSSLTGITLSQINGASIVPQWVKVTKTFSQFSTSGLTNDISIYTLPAKGYIHDVKVIPTTAFSGGLIAAYTVSVGIAGALTKYAIATNIFTGNSTVAAIHTPLVGLESISGTTDIRAQAVSVGGNLNVAVAGSVDIYLLISTLS